MFKTNNTAADKLKKRMQALTFAITDTMIAMPAKYPYSYLASTLSFTVAEFRRHMRATTLTEVAL